MDHLITTNMLKEQCYCGQKLHDQPWKSSFNKDIHYKTTTCCNCGRSLSLTVDFMGSGHDNWDGTRSWTNETLTKNMTKIRNLDNIVKRARDYQNDQKSN